MYSPIRKGGATPATLHRWGFLTALLLITTSLAPAAVLSHTWRESKLTLTLDDGFAAIEWINPTTVRVTRNAADALIVFSAIKHDPVLVALEDTPASLKMRSRYLTVEVERAISKIRVRYRDDDPIRIAFPPPAGVEVSFGAAKIYGLATNQPRLALTGERLNRGNGFLHTDHGYGINLRAPAVWEIDTTQGIARTRDALDCVIYYGPSVKEILEQHKIVTALDELHPTSLALLTPSTLPAESTTLPQQPIVSWDHLADLVRRLNHWSLSAIQYPAFDLALADPAPAAIKQRALDLAALIPIIYRSEGKLTIDRATRDAFVPYFTTYLREAYERGFPLIRALPLQFPIDPNADQHPHEFMLGDEFLLAPVIDSTNRRRLTLPRGLWTDLRTNQEYRGAQDIEIEAPPGRVPMFARNGSLFPLATRTRTELHYIPSLGGEFFQWEPDLETYSQYHAAPAGDYLRVEIEAKVARTYEWVLHHTRVPSEVGEESLPYRRATSQTSLRPGTWWHDPQRNNLHIMLRAERNSDHIINVSFPANK